MSRKCPECASTNCEQDPSTTEYTCLECGTVVENASFTNEAAQAGEYITSKSSGGSRGNFSQKYSESRVDFSQLYQYCDMLNLTSDIKSTSKHIYQTILIHFGRDATKPTGTIGQLRTAAAIYLSIKKHKKPISLTELAKQFQLPKEKLGKIIYQCETSLGNARNISTPPEYDPALFVEKFCGELKPALSTEDRAKVIVRAKFITKVALLNSLIVGRNPLGIVAAVLFMSLESLNFSKYLTKTGRAKLCESLNISLSTAMIRRKEMVDLWVQKAKEFNLPWDVDANTPFSDIFADIEPLLTMQMQEQEKKQENFSSPSPLPVSDGNEGKKDDRDQYNSEDITLPPSFRASIKARKRREDKIKRARARIDSALIPPASQTPTPRASEDDLPEAENTDKDLDWEDLLIEQLLLKNVDENAILDGYYDNSLANLIPLPTHDVDSKFLTEEDFPDEELSHYIYPVGSKRKTMDDLDSLPSPKR